MLFNSHFELKMKWFILRFHYKSASLAGNELLLFIIILFLLVKISLYAPAEHLRTFP